MKAQQRKEEISLQVKLDEMKLDDLTKNSAKMVKQPKSLLETSYHIFLILFLLAQNTGGKASSEIHSHLCLISILLSNPASRIPVQVLVHFACELFFF